MKVNDKEKYTISNFSGGKDSTAMTLHLIEIGEHIDEVIYFDSGWDFPAMYKHIARVRNVVEQAGIKFTMLKPELSLDFLMFEYTPKRKNPALVGLKGHSWATSRVRWCTGIKKKTIDRYISKIKANHSVVQAIGIAADEKYRLERPNNNRPGLRFPLVEWGWTEADALQYCYSKGYGWDGLYNDFRRVSCFCCPLQPLAELRVLYKKYPELWQKLKDMDIRTWRDFKAGWSVAGLEERFEAENRQIHIEVEEK